MRSPILGALWASCLVAVLANPARATELVVFGDSLSDTGNLGCGPLPYYDSRCSNGPVWVEGLADGLGGSALPSDGGGTNFAVAGARSDEVLDSQIPAYLSGGVDPSAIHVIWIGSKILSRTSRSNPD